MALAQRGLARNVTLLERLGRLVRGCIDCEEGGDALPALKTRSLGFADACPTANAARAEYEA